MIRPFRKINKILSYDLKRVPRDLINIVDTREKEIGAIFFSFIYISLIVLMIISTIKIARYDALILIPIYVTCIILNLIIINGRRYLFCLDKHPIQGLKKVLFILSGPFGILKTLHLIACLALMINERHIRLIAQNTPDLWHRSISVRENKQFPFLLSLMKYQKRLREDS